MITYTIRQSQAPIDAAASIAYINQFPWPSAYRPFSFAQMIWNPRVLAVRMETDERPRYASLQGFTEEVYTECAMELFLMPDPSNNNRYFNWEYSPKGAMFHSIGTSRYNRTPLCPAGWSQLFDVHTELFAWGWKAEFVIPIDYIQSHIPTFRPEEGGEMRANFYKTAEKTDMPHYGCWSPVLCDKPDFHIPDYFGRLVFGHAQHMLSGV